MANYLKFNVLVLAGILMGASATEMTNAPATEAAGTNSAPGLSGTNYGSFRLITERNIFNQNRSPRTDARRSNTPTARSAPVIHALSLVGTISYARGNFAFFDGTSSEYRKPVKCGDTIAGYEVKAITPSSVTVANGQQEFEMKVGQQLRREEEGEWELATAPRITVAAASSPEGGGESPDSSGGDISEEEALKRLMEKRAKELNP